MGFGDRFCRTVCLSWIRQPFFTLFLFPLAVKLTGLRTGCQFLKNVNFSGIRPLKSIKTKALAIIERRIINTYLKHVLTKHRVENQPLEPGRTSGRMQGQMSVKPGILSVT